MATVLERYGQTDRQTDGRTVAVAIPRKNGNKMWREWEGMEKVFSVYVY